ncbi:hypothetical protein PMAYCL1PPCAC_02924, partial [Pristionchus mayeri]
SRMRLMIDVDNNSYPMECTPESPIGLLLAGLPINNWPDFGTIVALKNMEWRLSKADLNLYTLKTIGAEEGDMISFERTNYTEPPFELPPLGDKMTNLIRSIVVPADPREKKIETQRAADCRNEYVKLKNDRLHMAHFTFVAPHLVRFVLSNPDDLGGFMLVFKKYSEFHAEKMKALDERVVQTLIHTPELLTPPSTLYIKGLINGHEVAAMIDTGAQTTVMHSSLAQKLGLMDYVDVRHGVSAVLGVGGKTRPLGKVFGIDFQLTAGVISVSAIVLPSDGTMSNHFILGLDVMLCHGCLIDLPNRRLTFSGHHEPILPVEECQKIDKAKHGSL